MSGPRWKPLPASLPDPARELAERLRSALDRKGLSLRRLAADDEVHYSVTALHRFFSGQALPPRRLVDVVARRCGDDPDELHGLCERARNVVDEAGPVAETTDNAVSNRDSDGDRGRVTHLWRSAGLRRTALAAVIFVAGFASGIAISAYFADAKRSAAIPTGNNGPAGVQLLKNGTFTDTTSPWWSNSDVLIQRRGSQLWADAPGGSAHTWDKMVGHTGFSLTAGRYYVLTFDVSANKLRDIRVIVQLEHDPFDEALDNGVSLDTSTRHISFGFISPVTTNRGSLNFQLGGHPTDLTFILDNVSLVETPAPPST